MPARLLALLAAGAMVAGALAYRDHRESRDRLPANAAASLVCATEVGDRSCARLATLLPRGVEMTIEPALVTAGRIVGDPAAAPTVWVTARFAVDIVNEERRLSSRPFALHAGAVVARSRVGIAIWPDRAAVLNQACGAKLGWRCVGDSAPKQWTQLGGDATWGAVKAGLPDPTADASGLAVLGAASAEFLGRRDLAGADLDDDAFRDWLTAYERAVPGYDADATSSMLVRGPAAFDVAGVLEAQAGPALQSSARPTQPTLIYPAPVATLDLVVAARRRDGASERLASRLRTASGRAVLVAGGWRPPEGAKGDGLPGAGALDALRTAWKDLSR